ncbi:MAG: hypothetical protein ACLFNQ_14275 [Spirochaetaceae bacterium]
MEARIEQDAVGDEAVLDVLKGSETLGVAGGPGGPCRLSRSAPTRCARTERRAG